MPIADLPQCRGLLPPASVDEALRVDGAQELQAQLRLLQKAPQQTVALLEDLPHCGAAHGAPHGRLGTQVLHPGHQELRDVRVGSGVALDEVQQLARNTRPRQETCLMSWP